MHVDDSLVVVTLVHQYMVDRKVLMSFAEHLDTCESLVKALTRHYFPQC